MRYKYLWPAGLVLMLALLATILAVGLARRDLMAAGQLRFENELSAVREAVSSSLKTYGQVLKAGEGLFNATNAKVSRSQWAAFVRTLSIENDFPGIQGLGYAAVIPDGGGEQFQRAQRADGRADFTLYPPGDRESGTSIIFLEPEDDRNQRAIGYDMFSDPVRRKAMEAARDTGQPHMTGAVKLVQEEASDIQTGTLLYLPVFADGPEPTTVSERRQRLKGYVYGAFRMRDFFEQALAKHAPRALEMMDLRISDTNGKPTPTLLYDRGQSAPSGTESSVTTGTYKSTKELEVHGVRWQLEGRSSEAFDASLDKSRVQLILIGGLIISGLVTGVAASLAQARKQSALAADALQEEVTQRKAAQEQEQIANRELIHRVKNTLAVVSAISSQTARHSTTIEEFSSAFRERLHALARVHDMLRPNPAFSPELGQLIEQTIGPYRVEGETSVTLEGGSVEVPQNAAVLLSLLFNELATNATKYGAWSKPGGHVGIAWDKPVDGDTSSIEISWSERGGPPVVQPTKSGFGSNVIQFAIERGLNGKVERTFDPSGIRYRISFPSPKSHGAPMEGAPS